jgi:hypothetical protein
MHNFCTGCTQIVPYIRGWDSYRWRWRGFNFWFREKFLFSRITTMALESTQPPTQWVPVGLPPGQRSQNVKLIFYATPPSTPRPRVHKSYVTKFCTVAPYIFSIITEVPSPLHTNMLPVNMGPSRTYLITVICEGHSRRVGPQYGACFMSPFWLLEFRAGSHVCGTSLGPCPPT